MANTFLILTNHFSLILIQKSVYVSTHLYHFSSFTYVYLYTISLEETKHEYFVIGEQYEQNELYYINRS